MPPSITICTLPSASVRSQSDEPPDHHVGGNPPTSFQNPWPSAGVHHSPFTALKLKFTSPGLLPLPPAEELVQVRQPDWGVGKKGLKATWFGHASFLIETTANDGKDRGIRILLDPVFSERMSPVPFLGPKRFVSLPCKLDELPEVDLVVISHSHYDHLDITTVKNVYARRGAGNVHFLCGLGLKKWFVGCGLAESDVTELDWWDARRVNVEGVGSVDLTCTPSQHDSARSAGDGRSTLWCSWVLQEAASGLEPSSTTKSPLKKLFFAGDTAYKYVSGIEKEDDARPPCPAFAEIGQKFGQIDLALLPIGCFLPREFMSGVHASPEDSFCIHKDIRSKRSIGMHYGTIRAGISGQYEDVRESPRRWKACCEQEGLEWGKQIGLCDIGETIVVEDEE